MGTPNSAIARNALKEYLLKGEPPSVDVQCALRLDIDMLEQQHAEIKPQLRYTEGFVDLENASGYVRNFVQWPALVHEAGLTGARVLRFTRDDGHRLLSLSPVGSGSGRDIEIFLMHDGDWLVWDGGMYDQVEPSFRRFKSSGRVVQYIYSLAGDSHEFFTYDKRFRYWAHLATARRANARHEAVAVALVLREQLRVIMSASIAVKAERLKNQTRMVGDFQSVDARSGLLPDVAPLKKP